MRQPHKELSTRYATGWNVTKCHTCHAKRHDNLLGNHRKGEVLHLPPQTRRRHRKTRDSRRDTWAQKNEPFVRNFLQFLTISTRYQTGWNVTKRHACHAKRHDNLLERFCSFLHRHGEATGKPETRDETRGSIKTSISCKTSSNFDTSKSMFSCKIYKFSLEHENLQPQNRCFVRGFRRIFITYHISHKTSRLPRNLHPRRHLTQPCQCDSHKTRNTTPLKRCACHAK